MWLFRSPMICLSPACDSKRPPFAARTRAPGPAPSGNARLAARYVSVVCLGTPLSKSGSATEHETQPALVRPMNSQELTTTAQRTARTPLLGIRARVVRTRYLTVCTVSTAHFASYGCSPYRPSSIPCRHRSIFSCKPLHNWKWVTETTRARQTVGARSHALIMISSEMICWFQRNGVVTDSVVGRQ